MKGITDIEREIESIASSTKELLHSRDESTLNALNKKIDWIEREANRIIQENEDESEENQKLLVLTLSNMAPKLRDTIEEFKAIIDRKPMYKDLDIPLMLDILIRNIKSFVHFIGESKPLDNNAFSSDIELLESLEDQHKRILLTYLMQNWGNLNEVVHLMKVAETYKSMSSQLSNLYSLLCAKNG